MKSLPLPLEAVKHADQAATRLAARFPGPALAWLLALLWTVSASGQDQPTITAPPVDQTVVRGDDALFSVTVSGTGPFSYQWQFNGTNLPNDWINTLAGNGTTAYSGDGGRATKAGLNWPFGVRVDSGFNLYIADYGNNRIRKVDTNGTITTVAGNGVGGFSGDGNQATNASLSNPAFVLPDAAGNLYVADYSNNRIRKVDTNGIITTVAGNGNGTHAGDGGPALDASLSHPFGLALDAAGNLYIADAYNDRVRRVDGNGMITTVAGGGWDSGFPSGTIATNARLVYPSGVALDSAGNLYIADNNANCVVRVDTNGIIYRFAGTGSGITSGDGGPATNAGISYPRGLAVDASDNVYIAAFYDQRIRKVDTNGIISTVIGTGTQGYNGDNVSALDASLNTPQGVALDAAGRLYVADSFNNRVRVVAQPGPILKLTNVATNNTGGYSVVVSNAFGSVTSTVAWLNVTLPPAIEVQPQSQQILQGRSVTFAVQPGGTPPFGFRWYFNGSMLPGANDVQYTIDAVTTNHAGSYFVVVTNAYGSITSSIATLTVLLPPAIISGPLSQNVSYGQDALLSVSATGPGPYFFQWRLNGTNLPNGIMTVAGNGTPGFSGDFGPATNAGLSSPAGIARDSAGNLFIADTGNHRIRKVTPDGLITTVAGKAQSGFSGDGGQATNASLYQPYGVAVDALGNLFIADTFNDRIRKVATNGIIATVAGKTSPIGGFSGDGGPATNATLYSPGGVALDKSGSFYIADTFNNRIRKVATNGIIATVAGRAVYGFSGDGGQATNAALYSPRGLAMDGSGNLFIADYANSRIRKVATNGIITTFAGRSAYGFSGDGGLAANASLYQPYGVAVDASGNLFIADTYNHRIREVATNGIITTVAGCGTAGFSGDGNIGTNSTLAYPRGVAAVSADLVFIADSNNHRIRRLNIQGPELMLHQVTAANAGAYDVIVSNYYGSVTSHVAVVTVTPAVPILTANFGPGHAFQVQFNGMPLNAYVLQAATNLTPPVFWRNLATNPADANGCWSFTDTNALLSPALFYRVTLP